MLRTIFFSILSFITGAFLVAKNVAVEWKENYVPYGQQSIEECVESITILGFFVQFGEKVKLRIK